MKDAPIEHSDSNPDNDLTQPHFDDLAVLVAQPVEPIATPKRDWLAALEKPRMMIGALVIAALLGTTALALTLQLRREPRADNSATDTKTETIKAEPAKPEGPLGSIIQIEPSRAAKRTKVLGPRTNGNGKPVARRVGVIHFGSSSDRP